MLSLNFDARRFRWFVTSVLIVTGLLSADWAASASLAIAGKPSTSVTVGSKYVFQPTARNLKGKKPRFSISNLPSWASFNRTTGRLSGKPKSKHVGGYRSIRIHLTDGKNTARLRAFSITVTSKTANNQKNTNKSSSKPSISGAPGTTAIVGDKYRFKPTVSGLTSSKLAFSISNKPKWATFNTRTGLLSGQPTRSHLGKYANIKIRASDGKKRVTLKTFSILVMQSSGGTATLSWLPPTSNTNGSSLTNLAGYHIYYGKKSSALNESIHITNPSVSTYVVQNLAKGKYYFGIVAYNKAGAESSMSNIASKTVQ